LKAGADFFGKLAQINGLLPMGKDSFEADGNCTGSATEREDADQQNEPRKN
jgi:hypothetical protein